MEPIWEGMTLPQYRAWARQQVMIGAGMTLVILLAAYCLAVCG